MILTSSATVFIPSTFWHVMLCYQLLSTEHNWELNKSHCELATEEIPAQGWPSSFTYKCRLQYKQISPEHRTESMAEATEQHQVRVWLPSCSTCVDSSKYVNQRYCTASWEEEIWPQQCHLSSQSTGLAFSPQCIFCIPITASFDLQRDTMRDISRLHCA